MKRLLTWAAYMTGTARRIGSNQTILTRLSSENVPDVALINMA
ncbi:hypothetical protein [Litorimonas haliclonae]